MSRRSRTPQSPSPERVRQHRPQAARPRSMSAVPTHRPNRATIAYILLASLVICSLIAVTLQSVDLTSWLGNKDDEGFTDPNKDLISAQETIVATHPNDVEPLVELADMYAHSKRIDDAYATYEKAIALDPNNASVRYPYARTLQDNGKYQDAEAQYLKVLGIDGNNQNAHYYLAQLYVNWKPARRADAKQQLEECVRINPDSYNGQRAKNELATWDMSTPLPQSSPSPSAQER